MAAKLLIVDDEADIVGMLRDYFEINGYQVFTARNGIEALKQAEQVPDLILLDINMPDMDGLSVCKRIRNFISCPILFLTARIEEADKVNGFAVGGDDYIVKPFSIEELGARVAAHLRREERHQSEGHTKFEDDIVIDYSARSVTAGETIIPFAKKEFEIIELLSRNERQVFDKERIYERVWGYDGDGDNTVVVEHIRRIRTKFSAAGILNHIETIWGCGYKWISTQNGTKLHG